MSPAIDASAAPTDGAIAAALEMLELRYSVGPKFLAPPAPTPAQWQRAADLALRAPDHGGLRPFRFVVVDAAQRPALADLFALGAMQRGQGADDVEKARARAFNGPGLVALVARVRADVPDVPAHEQWLSVGAALMNFLNALHLMGFGAKALSGASVSDPAVRSAFCADGEVLANWIVVGRPTRAAHPKGSAACGEGPDGDVVMRWTGSTLDPGQGSGNSAQVESPRVEETGATHPGSLS